MIQKNKTINSFRKKQADLVRILDKMKPDDKHIDIYENELIAINTEIKNYNERIISDYIEETTKQERDNEEIKSINNDKKLKKMYKEWVKNYQLIRDTMKIAVEQKLIIRNHLKKIGKW